MGGMREPMGGPRRPRRRRRLLGWLLGLALATLLLSVTPVVLYTWLNPPISAFMLAERIGMWLGREPWEPLRHAWVDWERIAPAMRLAVVAAEDQTFPTHTGFDLVALRDAIDDWRDGGRLRGASTISQQVARNLFLWRGRSYVRKGLEVWFTLLLETLWSKRRILEVYLNIAEMGRGVYGVEAAAREHFDKPARELTAEQAALLAAVLPSPRKRDAGRPSAAVRERAEWIRGQMRNLGSDYLAKL